MPDLNDWDDFLEAQVQEFDRLATELADYRFQEMETWGKHSSSSTVRKSEATPATKSPQVD